MGCWIGLMSGTSLDGVDGVLAEDGAPWRVLAHVHRGFAPALRAELLALNAGGPDELHRAALAANALARHCAEVVETLLGAAGRARGEVQAVGAHGQTVRHRPGEFDGTGYTLQLLNGALLAERCGIDVVCDFRSRDVAAGGQGAPLVPAFHAQAFARPDATVAVLNLGGIANLTLLPPGGPVTGFDCGPGNVLLDLWCRRHHDADHDEAGAWAASGRIDEPLLRRLTSDPFFDRAPPKSTGRDLFNAGWLEGHLASGPSVPPEDVQATLAELTVLAVDRHLRRLAPAATQLHVCGGGARNAHLMRRLAARLPGVMVASTEAAGVAPEQVEALAFAWLARACVMRRSGNIAEVTGAAGTRILGAVYAAG